MRKSRCCIATASGNMLASESRIRDTDMASETTAYVRNTILQKAAVSMQAQANLKTQSALNLLR